MATGSRRPRIGEEFGIAHSPAGAFKNTLAACHPLEEEAGAPDNWKGDKLCPSDWRLGLNAPPQSARGDLQLVGQCLDLEPAYCQEAVRLVTSPSVIVHAM